MTNIVAKCSKRRAFSIGFVRMQAGLHFEAFYASWISLWDKYYLQKGRQDLCRRPDSEVSNYVRGQCALCDSCELVPAVPSPPPYQLHRDNRHRSHPPHFALTASIPVPQHLSQSKCGGLISPRYCSFRQRTPVRNLFAPLTVCTFAKMTRSRMMLDQGGQSP